MTEVWVETRTVLDCGDEDDAGTRFVCVESLSCPRCHAAYPPDVVGELEGRCKTPGCGFVGPVPPEALA